MDGETCNDETVSSEIVRPSRGEMLTVVAAALALLLFGGVSIGDGWRDAAALAPWLVLLVGVTWAAFSRPHIEVSDAGIRLVNVLRTVVIRWPAVTGVETRYMLTIVTSHGEYAAWSAPIGGRRGAARSDGRARRLAEPDVRALGDSTLGAGDITDTPSGAAALVIRRRWQQLRDAGHLDDGRLERQSAEIEWHWPLLVAGAALVLLGVVLY